VAASAEISQQWRQLAADNLGTVPLLLSRQTPLSLSSSLSVVEVWRGLYGRLFPSLTAKVLQRHSKAAEVSGTTLAAPFLIFALRFILFSH
jgi:hypothetical protein